MTKSYQRKQELLERRKRQTVYFDLPIKLVQKFKKKVDRISTPENRYTYTQAIIDLLSEFNDK